MDPIPFIHNFSLADAPAPVVERAKMSLLDLLGIAIGAEDTRLAHIIADHASEEFAGPIAMLFDGRTASASGVALAAGMRIDALDGHDGFNPSKGHIGCSLFAAILPIAIEQDSSGHDVLAALLMGYEFGSRAAMAQHGTVDDFHTSGSWGAVACAAAAARLMRLDHESTRHALGIAEYHGPRSQMMRCIDYPTMLKDGSGWGAMTSVSAAKLARSGFTGAPSLIVEQADSYWADLGEKWYMLDQYYKPYPVCRWAQAPIEAALSLRSEHNLHPSQISSIDITTFHESIRLACNEPKTTEEAQYSTSFPTAIALVHGDITASSLKDSALNDPEVKRLSKAITMHEDAHCNAAFPLKRYANVDITLTDGQRVSSDWHQPKWDHTAPPSAADISAKFHNLADDKIGTARANHIETLVWSIETQSFTDLVALICAPIAQPDPMPQ